jgi:ABC-type sugar transport system substrate-binding protein
LNSSGALGADSDGLAVVSKNIEPVKGVLTELRAAGKPVVALVSDLDPNARSAYVGIDNRASGQLAGFIFGRCLEHVPLAAVLWSGGISFGGVVAFLCLLYLLPASREARRR